MTGDSTLRVYVNGQPVDVAKSATVLDAVECADPLLAAEVSSGDSVVADSRGLPIEPDAAVYGGAILRVAPVRRRETEL
ncbi:MAG: hypothetical protein ABI875_02375 [Gemmatimonadales bacterium]